MDPADGARYSLPATLAVAYFAARGLTRFRVPFVTLFTLASLAFVSALLSQRATSASPPVQAAAFAQRTFPSNAIALYELPLWPHATYLLAAHHPMRVDNGLRAYFDRPDVPLYIYADGATSSPSARTFRWQPSDAYSTLTRNHYRVVSVIPLPPEQRFLPLRGVYAPERAPEGEGWRWLAPLAELQLPSRDRRGVDITLGLPATTPFASNDLTISIDGQPVRTVRIARGATLLVSLPLSRGGATIRIDAARSFVAPPDPRTLAVRLLRVVAR
jgi:hypothetical protein